MLHGGAQHVGHLDVVVDVAGDVGAGQSLCGGLLIEALSLAIQAVAHQLECDVRVAVDARALPLCGEELENLVDIGHVKVAAQTQIFGAPVIASQKGVYECQSALAGGAVTQMAHQQLALHLFGDATENLGDGILAFGLFAKHIFGAGLVRQVHAGNTSALLSAVVLFLHHQVQLVKTVGPGAVFLLVVVKWFQ